jgi:hypothetical protein
VHLWEVLCADDFYSRRCVPHFSSPLLLPHPRVRLYYEQNATTTTHKDIPRVIKYNVYDIADRPTFETIMNVNEFYRRAVQQKADKEGYVPTFRDGMQVNAFSGLPYTPIRLDSRYGHPTSTPLSRGQGFERHELSDINVCGVEAVANYSATAIIGNMAVKALRRRMYNFRGRPFIVSVHFNAPVRGRWGLISCCSLFP